VLFSERGPIWSNCSSAAKGVLGEEPGEPVDAKSKNYDMLKQFEVSDSNKHTKCMPEICMDPNAKKEVDDCRGVKLLCPVCC